MIEVRNKKLKYFISAFNYIINIKKDEEVLLNPHNILLFIVEDLTYGQNDRNLKFWRNKIKAVFNNDPVFKTNKYFIDKLVEHICSDKKYALQICKYLLEKMENYSSMLCRYIYKICFDDKEQSQEIKEEILYLAASLYIELTLKGYSEFTQKELFKCLFYESEEFNYNLCSFFPSIPEGVDNEKINEYIDNMTESTRLKELESFFELCNDEYWYICGIDGIYGEELDISIGDVKIYNTNCCHKFEFEDESSKQQTAKYYIDLSNKKYRIAVKLECIDIENIEYLANEKIEETLDVINNIHIFQTPIVTDQSWGIILDRNKKIIQTKSFVEDIDKINRNIKGLNYNIFDKEQIHYFENVYKDYQIYVLSQNNDIVELMKDSMRWYRKGGEAKRKEDKLLNYWISLENLIPDKWDIPQSMNKLKDDSSKFSKIYSIVPDLFFKQYVYNYFWDIFLYFSVRYSHIGVSVETAQKCNLYTPVKNSNLFNFIDHIDELLNEINNDFEIDIIYEMKKLLNGDISIEKWIKNRMVNYMDNLIISYRMRNMIVHNAKFKISFIDCNINFLKKVIYDMQFIYLESIKNKSVSDSEQILYSRHLEEEYWLGQFKQKELRQVLQEICNEKILC